MLEQIRNATKTWLAGLVVGLLVISFALWGVSDIFTTNLNDPVAVVDGTEIGAEEFIREYSSAFRQARFEAGGSLTPAQAIAAGLHTDTLEVMINRTIINKLTESQSIRTSDDFVRRQILTNPAFAGPTGQFEQRTYLEQIYNIGYTAATFEDAIRQDLARSQLLGTVVSGVFMPQGLAAALYDYSFERRSVQYFLLPPALAGDIADPGEDDLRAHYAANTVSYTAPEYRTLTVLNLSTSDLAENIEVPDEDIETLYEIRRAQFDVPERRMVEQLSFNDQTAAETALSALEAGADFQSVGGSYVNLGAIALGQGLDQAVTEAAFALEGPGLGPVVEGLLSISVFRVTEIIPAEVTAIEDVRDELRLEIAMQIADEELFGIAERVQDRQAGGQDLVEIGAEMRLPVLAGVVVDRQGVTPEGETIAALTETAGLLPAAWNQTEGEDSGFRDTPDGDFYIVRLDEISPARTIAFEDVREEVLESWREDQILNVLRGIAEDAAARINSGDDFAVVASDLGLDVRDSSRSLRRNDTTEVFSRATLNALFSAPVGTAASGRMFLGSSYVVAQVTDVEEADLEAASDQIDTIRETLDAELAGELVELYVTHGRETLNVRINDTVVTQAVGQVN